MAEYEMEPFGEVMMLGRWPVRLPAYRVEHCRVQPNWENGRLLSMHAHLKPGDVLYDVGAEHGDLSALYATWVTQTVTPDLTFPAGERIGDVVERIVGESVQSGGVVLVEGSDKFWPVIRATFEDNGISPIGCFAGFASDVDSPESERGPGWADIQFTRPIDGGGWPSWANDFPVEAHHGFKSLVESKQTIQNIRFDTLAELVGPPDAMTIDVEGAEARVLRGSERLLNEVRPLVWVSLHPQLLWFDYPEWEGMTADDVKPWFVGFMDGYDYTAYFLEDNHESHYICVPDERDDIDPYLGVEYLRP